MFGFPANGFILSNKVFAFKKYRARHKSVRELLTIFKNLLY